jgi:predicted negative regulator of RcsB-dependent stress response
VAQRARGDVTAPETRWARLDRIFNAAVEMASGERAAFLTRECADDIELRRSVDAMLDTLQSGDRARTAVHDTMSELVRRQSLVGRLLGAYRLTEEIGRGGMGRVYLGERADGAFRGHAAIKALAGSVSADHLRRFQAEREILASLTHPNIARLLDAGETPDGLPYMVMEFVDGLPLDRYCDLQGLDVRGRLKLFLQICDVVQFAHDRGIVHRDLKPTNVLVSRDGTPKLLDFGIAKVLEGSQAAVVASATTSAGGPLTLSYSSPEQVLGRAITVRTDVYALGLTLYELLSGRRAQIFGAITAQAVEQVICHAAPAAPSAAAAAAPLPETRARARALAGDLDTIVLTALRKEPEARYRSARAMANDVQRYLTGLPVTARRDSWWYRAERAVRRNRARLAAAVVLGGIVVGGWRFGAASAMRTSLRAEAQRAATDLAAAFSSGTISRGDVRFDSVFARMPILMNALQDDRNAQAGLLDIASQVQLALGDIDAADASLMQALGDSSDLRADALTAARLQRLAVIRIHRGDAAGGTVLAERALAHRTSRADASIHDILPARAVLATALHAAGLADSALAVLKESQVRARAVRMAVERVPLEAFAGVQVAEQLYQMGRPQDAHAAALAASSLARGLPSDDPIRALAAVQVDRMRVATRPAAGPVEFLPVQLWRSPIGSPRTFVSLDANGDGRMDLAWNHVNASGENATVVALAGGPGRFVLRPVVTHPDSAAVGGWKRYRLVAGDFDGDGAADLAWVGGVGEPRVYVGLSSRDGSFRFLAPFELRGAPTLTPEISLQACDVTGDGKAELVWGDTRRLAVWLGVPRRDGSFAVAGPTGPSASTSAEQSQLHCGDVDGDATRDLVWTSLGEFNRTWAGFVDAVGSVEWTGPQRHAVSGLMNNQLGVWSFYRPLLADVDGDGRDDLIWADPASPVAPANTLHRVYIGLSAGGKGASWRYDPQAFQDGAGQGDPSPFRVAVGAKSVAGATGLVWNAVNAATGMNRAYLTASRRNKFDLSAAPVLHPASALWSLAELVVGDVSGDRLADLVWVVDHGSLAVYVGVSR